jgi:tetratricopeptide (TPR) repeat protein
MSRLVVVLSCVSLLLACSGAAFGQADVSQEGEGQRQSAEIQQYMEQAQQALRERRPDAAAQAYRAILKIDPANVNARANLGVVVMAQGDWAGAAEQFQKALELQPSLWKVQALLGLCEVHLKRSADATKLLAISLPHLEDSRLRLEAGLQLVEIWYQGGELEKASTAVSQLQELYPTNAAVLYAAYRVHTDLAFQAIDSLALAAPESAQLHLAMAEHMVNEGHAKEAIAEYRKALESGPGLAGVHYELGEALLAESHLEPNRAAAQKEFESALALNPGDARAECRLGKIEIWRVNRKAAFDDYERALKMNPSLGCAQLGMGELLIDEGRMQEALTYLQSAARSEPSNAEARYRLAILYERMGKNDEAERELAAFHELKKVQTQLQNALQQVPENGK